jgi:hypothetical protein
VNVHVDLHFEAIVAMYVERHLSLDEETVVGGHDHTEDLGEVEAPPFSPKKNRMKERQGFARGASIGHPSDSSLDVALNLRHRKYGLYSTQRALPFFNTSN